MGVVAVMARTIPVGVVLSAHCMQLTPSVCPAKLFATTQGQARRHLLLNCSLVGNAGGTNVHRDWCHLTRSNQIPPITRPPMILWKAAFAPSMRDRKSTRLNSSHSQIS